MKMEIKIRLFSNLGYYLPEGGNRFSFIRSFADDVTVGEMLKQLGFPEKLRVVAAVNSKAADNSLALKDQDDVDVFRPSGEG